jgi:hypothetical protein
MAVQQEGFSDLSQEHIDWKANVFLEAFNEKKDLRFGTLKNFWSRQQYKIFTHKERTLFLIKNLIKNLRSIRHIASHLKRSA